MHPQADEYAKLCAARDAILAQVQPLEEQAAQLYRAVSEATAQWRAVREQIAALEAASGLRDVSMRIVALARSFKGNHSLKAEGA